MSKIIYIVQKNFDLKVIRRLEGLGHDVTTMCFRHRDWIEANQLKVSNPVSFPYYWKSKVEESENLGWYSELLEYKSRYGLREMARYSFLDVGRSRISGLELKDDEYLSYLIIKFFLENRVLDADFCVGELSKSFNLICYDLCKSSGLYYLHYVGMAFQKGMAFTDDKFNLVTMNARWDKLAKSEKNKVIDEVEQKVNQFRQKPEYQLSGINTKKVNIKPFLKKAIVKIGSIHSEIEAFSVDRKFRLDQFYISPVLRFIRNNPLINIRYSINKLRWQRLTKNELPEQDYFYYSLHVQPETTTSLFSEFLIDESSQQASLVEFIAKQMPTGKVLVVKDHPYMSDKRSANFYKKLAGYPNVLFLPPWYDQFKIIKNCIGVITCVGTVGIEARMLNKPVCILENVYYSGLNVYRAQKISDVSKFCQGVLEGQLSQKLSSAEIEVLAKISNSISKSVENAIEEYFPDQDNSTNIERLVKGILTEYEYRKT